MNKTEIETYDYTWNPISGCWHGCEYCYARKKVTRFMKLPMPQERIPGEEWIYVDCDVNGVHHKQQIAILNEKPDFDKFGLWPFGFQPTFYRYKIGEPQRKRGRQRIFVGSMSDIWGCWIPNEWIEEILSACNDAPQHTYFFLTKNPKGYRREGIALPITRNFWYGTSISKQEDVDRLADLPLGANRFISIEPLLGRIDFDKRARKNIIPFADWVIIGAETGNRAGKVKPSPEWIEEIVDYCRKYDVPVFMKNSLGEIYKKAFMQCWPKGVKGVE